MKTARFNSIITQKLSYLFLILMGGVTVSTAADVPNNGAVAYAYPVSGITVDGDPSDWDTSLTSYPIGISYNNTLAPTDFAASFQVGYNLQEGALYFLVTVQDEDNVVDTSENADWNTQDTWNFYLDPRHSKNGSGVNLFQFGQQFKDKTNSDTSWDPQEKQLDWDQVTMKVTRKGTTTYYEAKAVLGAYVQAGKVLGMDHAFIDKDNDDQDGSFVLWGHDTGKSQSSARLGDLVLVGNNQNLSKVKGTVQFKDPKAKRMINRLSISSLDDTATWMTVRVDTLGNYQTQLPKGNYLATPFWDFHNNDPKTFKIDKDKSSVKLNVTPGSDLSAAPLIISSSAEPELIGTKGIINQFNPDNPKQVDDFITTYQKFYQIPGVSLAIIKNGKVVYTQSYGYANNYTKTPVTDKTLFEAASITKPVFAYAVCRLAERGIIDLDQPLHTYLPFDDIAHDERYKKITARHVMTHKTGFPNWAWMNEDGKINIKFEPGTDYGYSGEGFEYLKRVIVQITGKPVNQVLKEEVLGPLELKNTFFSHTPYLAKVVSHGHYDNRPTRANLPSEPGMAWSMHTNAMEFTQFALGLMQRKGMKPETYKEMFTVQTQITEDEENPFPEGFNYFFGLGIALEDTPLGRAFRHGGNNGDFKCQFKMYQESQSGYVIFTNSDYGDSLHDDLDQFLFTGKIPEPESK